MTGIWTNMGEGWELGSPQPFQDEATLHSLIEENLQLLPLAGSPGGVRSGAGVCKSGVSQESSESSETWEAAFCRLRLRR